PRMRLAWLRPVAMPRHSPRRSAIMTISMTASPPAIVSASQSASASCSTDANSAHLGVKLQTDEDRAVWKLLQDHRAMMDWIGGFSFSLSIVKALVTAPNESVRL